MQILPIARTPRMTSFKRNTRVAKEQSGQLAEKPKSTVGETIASVIVGLFMGGYALLELGAEGVFDDFFSKKRPPRK